MTRAERIKAFSMRLDGYSWQEIGKKLGYEPATVFGDISRCIHKKRWALPIAYPALREICARQFDGSISKMATAMGVSDSTLRNQLNGTCPPSGNTIRIVTEVFGLSFKEAFGQMDRD